MKRRRRRRGSGRVVYFSGECLLYVVWVLYFFCFLGCRELGYREGAKDYSRSMGGV